MLPSCPYAFVCLAGPGSLTRSLVAQGAAYVLAVEKDPRFIPSLQILAETVPGRLFITHGDALDVNDGDLVKIIRHMCRKNANKIMINK